jgi:transcriptional regulator with XRE-family HTH domain
MTLHEIGKAIKEARRGQQMSQHELSKLSRVSQPIISRIEACTRSPNIKTLDKLLAALRLDVVIQQSLD